MVLRQLSTCQRTGHSAEGVRGSHPRQRNWHDPVTALSGPPLGATITGLFGGHGCSHVREVSCDLRGN